MRLAMVERPQLEALNGLRGIAAIAVVFFHASSAVKMNFAPSGYLAVDFFFVLSGFVIGRAYEQRLRDGLRLGAFMQKRAVRFYPLYLLGTVLGLAVLTANAVFSPPAPLTWQQLAGSTLFMLAYLPSPVTPGLFPLNVPAWSLFFELAVNALFAVILWRLSSRMLGALAAFVFTILALLVFDAGGAAGGAEWDTFCTGLARTVLSFVVGMLLARFNHPTILGARTAAALSIALAALLCLPIPTNLRPLYDLAFIAIASPAIIYVAGRVGVTRLDRVLGRLGLISFPIYAIHYPFTDLLRPLSRHFDGGLLVMGSLAGLLIVSNAIGKYDLALQKWVNLRSQRRLRG